MVAIFLYIVALVFWTGRSFKTALGWAVVLLFCAAPTLACLAVVIPQPSWVSKVCGPLCTLSHCLLYFIGYIGYGDHFAELKPVSETTQKYINGPAGQEFSDLESGEATHASCYTRTLLDVRGKQATEEEEKKANEVRDRVRRAVRHSLFVASVMWFVVFLTSFADLFRQETPRAAVEPVTLTWASKSFWPHSMAVAGGVTFIADEYQIFRVPVGGDTPQEESCTFTGSIADVAATCDEGEQNCRPLLLLAGETPRVLDCRTGEETPLLQQSSQGPATRFATHSASESNVKMLALDSSSVVEYRRQSVPQGWRPFWKKLTVNGNSARGLDYDVTRERLFVFEHSVSDGSSKVQVANLRTGSPLGRWALPNHFAPLVAGAVTQDGSVLLMPEGPAPTLLRWVPPL